MSRAGCGSLRAANRCRTHVLHYAAPHPGDDGAGSRAAGLAMAFKLIRPAEARWRALNGPRLVALVRVGAVFEKGAPIERRQTAGSGNRVISRPDRCTRLLTIPPPRHPPTRRCRASSARPNQPRGGSAGIHEKGGITMGELGGEQPDSVKPADPGRFTGSSQSAVGWCAGWIDMLLSCRLSGRCWLTMSTISIRGVQSAR